MGNKGTAMAGLIQIEAIQRIEPAAVPRPDTDRPAVLVPAAALHGLMQTLRDHSDFAFDMLLDHTAIDWLADGEIEAVYQLFSTLHGWYLQVGVRVPRDNPVVPTVCDLWPVAQWQEREAYDLMGVLYDNHPDLRRLFLEDDWQGHPLRKDYKDDDMLERP